MWPAYSVISRSLSFSPQTQICAQETETRQQCQGRKVSEPVSLMSPALAGRFSTTSASWEAPYRYILFLFSISILRVMLYERQTADDRLLF